MNTPTRHRLLSPRKRRIYPNMTSANYGNGDAMTMNALTAAGWTLYEGPALTDAQGYVIPGTDPKVVPQPPAVGSGRWDGDRRHPRKTI